MSIQPARYWIPAWAAFGFTTILACLPERVSPRRWLRALGHPALFAFSVVFALLAFRWPTWFAPAQLDPDEAQMIAGAITLRHYPVFWRDVDGTTHGPLDDYVLLAASASGASLDFASARFIATLLQAGALLAVWLAACRLFDPFAARVGLLPPLCLWATTSFPEFFQYSTEHVPIFLAAWGGACGAVALTTSSLRWRRVWLAAAGVMLGLVPYAKLQGLPLAGCIGVILIIAAWLRPARSASGTGRACGLDLSLLLGGAVASTVVLAIALLATGMGGEFYQAYLRNNFAYAEGRAMSYAAQLRDWPNYLTMAPGFPEFFWGSFLASALLLVPAVFRGGRHARFTALGWLVAAAAFLTVILPGREYQHYFHFLVPAIGFLLASECYAVRTNFAAFSPKLASIAPVVVVLAAIVPQVQFRFREENPYLTGFRENRAHWRSAVAQRLRAEAKPGDRMAIWGWQPNYYVETGLPQGTRDAQTGRMIDPNESMRDYYRQRYLDDFIRNRPRWFVDAVGGDNFAFKDRSTQGHETFLRLNALIMADYELVADIDGSRIYRRKTRPASAR